MYKSNYNHRQHHLVLNDIDLRLLKVFTEIVRCNGFSAAQASLGMSQSTISTHMRHLEERLALRLCERGRSGFQLTLEGSRVHSAVLDLFGSIERFQGEVGDVQGELNGQLAFGTVDAMVTNSSLNLHEAFRTLAIRAPKVEPDFDIAAPQVLLQGVLGGRYHLVLLPEQQHFSSSNAITIFSETQHLYCGKDHPLFKVANRKINATLLAQHAFAGRSYMQRLPICGVNFEWRAVTAHMEGTLILLNSGCYIGFLPSHYAAEGLQSGRLRALAPSRITFANPFQIIFSGDRPSRAARLLADAIIEQTADCKA
ncbi:LysR family transcriptional regulator [Granulosicoccus antarcticus]|uniref:HTH-type transcriptional activator CmpR n=1 Tax=Granulosicoccus antarcticus IMCC3135 TaxID=1192854 RepID=A0A2Z2P0W4_9GAMM|nr:LysR family transcriptional regulator [Granulosicoccus antarcticus]ASJ73174.1 HTH-type transcriptional activator CmpR [Granulosicoccus antarcticus IMCC3135]